MHVAFSRELFNAHDERELKLIVINHEEEASNVGITSSLRINWGFPRKCGFLTVVEGLSYKLHLPWTTCTTECSAVGIERSSVSTLTHMRCLFFPGTPKLTHPPSDEPQSGNKWSWAKKVDVKKMLL